MMVTKYVEKIKIFNHYTNYKGRLFAKVLCDLFNDAAEVQTEEYGVDVDTLNAQGMTWMLHRLHIHLFKMPHKNEEVLIETWPSGIDRFFALRDYRLVRENGEELVRATSEWMYIDMKRRRPLRLPENVIAMSTGHHIEKLELDSILNEKDFGGEMQVSRDFTATFDNIDFNGHVTQASYMRWITNSLPFEFLKTYVLLDVEVIYAHEIMPDSTIHSAYRMEEKENVVTVFHQVKNESGELNHCIAKTIWEKH
ncbi:MAG: thioesterase [Odoribacter sp.]